MKDGRIPEEVYSLDKILAGIMYGLYETDAEMVSFLETYFDIAHDAVFTLFAVYLGNNYEENISKIKKVFEQDRFTKNDIKSVAVEMPSDRIVLLFRFGRDEKNTVINEMRDKIRQNKILLHGSCMGIAESQGVNIIRNIYEELSENLQWTMVLGEDEPIILSEVKDVIAEKCIYPTEIEMEIKNALYSSDKEAVVSGVKKFYNYFFTDKIYNPYDIKDAFIREIWKMREITLELYAGDSVGITQAKITEMINGAKSRREMENILNTVSSGIFQKNEIGGNVGLTVKKAIRYINDGYVDGITLFEIAGKLGITPEYLSAQFQKEMGVTFSTYIRDHRIFKAKQLLISGNMKVYEVAKEVGYKDAKYFSRVFRQVTGKKPDEYRKDRN